MRRKRENGKDLAFQGWMSPQSLAFKDHLGERACVEISKGT